MTFRYKKAFDDGSKPIQYGLIAEEVADVLPDLVIYNNDGKPETVKYHLLPVLMLNEIQRQQRDADEQRKEVERLRAENDELRRELRTQRAEMESRLAKIEHVLTAAEIPGSTATGQP